jgi:hypothetical protein
MPTPHKPDRFIPFTNIVTDEPVLMIDSQARKPTAMRVLGADLISGAIDDSGKFRIIKCQS